MVKGHQRAEHPSVARRQRGLVTRPARQEPLERVADRPAAQRRHFTGDLIARRGHVAALKYDVNIPSAPRARQEDRSRD